MQPICDNIKNLCRYRQVRMGTYKDKISFEFGM